jgi:hypothetical protein
METKDLFQPTVMLAIIAFTDEKTGLLWFLAKLMMMFYFVLFIRDFAKDFYAHKPKKEKTTEDRTGDEVTKILRGTPSYPEVAKDPFPFLDKIKSERR